MYLIGVCWSDLSVLTSVNVITAAFSNVIDSGRKKEKEKKKEIDKTQFIEGSIFIQTKINKNIFKIEKKLT